MSDEKSSEEILTTKCQGRKKVWLAQEPLGKTTHQLTSIPTDQLVFQVLIQRQEKGQTSSFLKELFDYTKGSIKLKLTLRLVTVSKFTKG